MNKTFLNFIDSQKLYRLGIKSESGFHYHKRTKDLHWDKDLFLGMASFDSVYVPAYTDSDLNEALPHKIIIRQKTVPLKNYDLVIRKSRNGKYISEYENQIKESPSLIQLHADTEVESKSKMILFLQKNKLLNNDI